ncbi:MAG: EB domain-containing protein [Myxococcota bacterium]
MRHRRLLQSSTLVVAALSLLAGAGLTAGCFADADRNDLSFDGTPGGEAWQASTEVACETNEQCGDGESCQDGVCQMARCQEDFRSRPPMGANRYFGIDAEFVVLSDDVYVEAYDPEDGHMDTWWAGEGLRVVDVAGGDLTGRRPHALVAALSGSNELAIQSPDLPSRIDIGFPARSLATGDVDNDGIFELVAMSSGGRLAICDLSAAIECTTVTLSGQFLDLAVVDVDGDGFAEPLLLSSTSDQARVTVFNHNFEETNEDRLDEHNFDFPVSVFGAGQLAGPTSPPAIVLVEDVEWGFEEVGNGNWTGDDRLHVYDPIGEQFTVRDRLIEQHAIDISIGDRDSDEVSEIAILNDENHIDVYLQRDASVVKRDEMDLGFGNEITRLTLVDYDGDSVSVELIEGPELVAGATVPMAVLVVPPYPAGAALSNDQRASVSLGAVEFSGDSTSQTVTFGVGANIAFGGKAGPFRSKITGSVNWGWTSGESSARRRSISAKYSLKGEPEVFGNDYAGVVLACGCYHRYRYEAFDPRRVIGGNGQFMDVMVPVGGATQLWSSKRYNAVAAATGKYPVINVAPRIGDVSSYGRELLDLDGNRVPEADLVFDEFDTYSVSDVGNVSFSLSAREISSSSSSRSITYGASLSVGVGFNLGPVEAGVDVTGSVSWGSIEGYSVLIGQGQTFSGSAPPIPDNPATPEDEFELNRFSFTPFVYRHRYIDYLGEEAGFYVINYAVSD